MQSVGTHNSISILTALVTDETDALYCRRCAQWVLLLVQLYQLAGDFQNMQHVLHVLEVARKLVELNEKQNPLSTAPAVECIGLICDQSSENADAVVRANGLHAMLCTLEDDCPAQVWLAHAHATWQLVLTQVPDVLLR